MKNPELSKVECNFPCEKVDFFVVHSALTDSTHIVMYCF